MSPARRDADPLAAYFSGERLYGDDLPPAEIERWFEEEREGYANLGARDAAAYEYPYAALDQRHLFRHIRMPIFKKVLSLGGAYGHELRPLCPHMREAVIVEPSDAFQGSTLDGLPLRYVKPTPSGLLPFEDEYFDFACALSVLHHIPNVTTVLREIFRVVRSYGWVIIREPTTSMGDWRKPRRGLTRNERGLPIGWFRATLEQVGFGVERETRCLNPITPRLGGWLPGGAYNSDFMVRFDEVLTRMLLRNDRYHARGLLDRLRPWAVAYVLRRP